MKQDSTAALLSRFYILYLKRGTFRYVADERVRGAGGEGAYEQDPSPDGTGTEERAVGDEREEEEEAKSSHGPGNISS